MASKKVRQREITDPTVKAIFCRLFPLYYANEGIADTGCDHRFSSYTKTVGRGFGGGYCFRAVHEDNLHISASPEKYDPTAAIVWEDIYDEA